MNTIVLALLGAWLAVWFFWIGTLLGGLSNVWLHNLTGGAWGDAIRVPLRRASQQVPIVSLLFLPLLLGMHMLYPWAAHAADGVARWQGELSSPAFKSAWLAPPFFVVRSIAYLLIWNALVLLSSRPGLERSKPFSAAALIVYGFSMSLAAVDWIMSLMPLWYSSVFGWLVGIGQMLAGLAFGIVCATRTARGRPPPAVFRDLGNLLLMYVLLWAYLAFSQFLIIWAENLPHEIMWYITRRQGPWPTIAWLLAIFFFIAPLLLLLSRHAKQTPGMLGALAWALLAMQLLDTCWLALPSIDIDPVQWSWAVPASVAIAAILATVFRRRLRDGWPVGGKEVGHA